MAIDYRIAGVLHYAGKRAKRALGLIPEALGAEPFDGGIRLDSSGVTGRTQIMAWVEALQAAAKTAASGVVEVHTPEADVVLRLRPKRPPVEVRSWSPSIPFGHVGPIRAMATNGHLLALAGAPTGLRHAEVTLWDLDGRYLARGGEGDTIQSIAFSPDGRELALGRNGGRVSLWRHADATMRDVKVGGPTTSVWRLAYAPDGLHLATAASRVVLVDPARGKVVARHRDKASSVAWLGEHLVVAAYASSKGPTLELCDRELARVKALDAPKPVRWEVAGTPDGERVLLHSSWKAEIIERDLSRRAFDVGGHAVAAHPNGTTFALKSRDTIAVLGRRSSPVPVSETLLSFALEGETLWLARGNVAVAHPLPPAVEVASSPVTPPPPAKPTQPPAPSPPTSAPTPEPPTWRSFVREHLPASLSSGPPDDDAAFARWLETVRDHPPKGSGPLDGWIWNDTPHSVDGAHVNDREVVFYTEHKNTRQGGGASAIPLATFLDEGPDACNYGAPPETLAALVIHAWLRLA